MSKLLFALYLALLSTVSLSVGYAADDSAGGQGTASRGVGHGATDTGRKSISTNTEKSDRDYQDKEIADAPPPPNRVRDNSSKLPR